MIGKNFIFGSKHNLIQTMQTQELHPNFDCTPEELQHWERLKLTHAVVWNGETQPQVKGKRFVPEYKTYGAFRRFVRELLLHGYRTPYDLRYNLGDTWVPKKRCLRWLESIMEELIEGKWPRFIDIHPEGTGRGVRVPLEELYINRAWGRADFDVVDAHGLQQWFGQMLPPRDPSVAESEIDALELLLCMTGDSYCSRAIFEDLITGRNNTKV